MKRRFDELVKSFSEELERKMVGGSQSCSSSSSAQRIRSGVARMFSQKSFANNKMRNQGMDEESETLASSVSGDVNQIMSK